MPCEYHSCVSAVPKDLRPWTEVAPRPESTVESAAWWLPRPGWLGGVASIGGIFGLIPADRRRFHPAADLALLRRDRSILLVEYKSACKKARREELAAPMQEERLFDPDEG
jgi:hypothetical protein